MTKQRMRRGRQHAGAPRAAAHGPGESLTADHFALLGDARHLAPRWASLATLGVVLTVTLAFFWLWRYGYTCDHVISGLMAKSILRRGEHPLFLWTLGYNGILLESYAVALFFRLFGHGPHVYYLFTLLCFWALTYLFYRHVRARLGAPTALLAVLLFVVSAPRLYYYVLRPQPNYTEIFLLGLLLLSGAQALIDRTYAPWVRRRTKAEPPPGHHAEALGPIGPRRASSHVEAGDIALLPSPTADAPAPQAPLGLALAVGFTLGFALYTYQLIFFFLGALGLYVLTLWAHDAPARARAAGAAAARLRRGGLSTACGGGALIALSPLLFFGGAGERLPLLASRFCFSAGAALVAFGLGIEWAAVRLPTLRRHGRALFAFASGALLGYAPSLYFTYVEHGHSRDRLRVSLNPEQVVRSFWLFVEAQARFLNAWDTPLGRGLGLLIVAAALWALATAVRGLWRVARHEAPLAAARCISPLLLLPLVTVPLFCFAAAAEDWESARWTIGLSFFFALAQAWAWQRCWRRGGLAALVATSLVAVVLVHNASCLRATLLGPEAQTFRGEELLEPLAERHITRAYADYWYAYSLSFITDEQLIVEPLYNNYSPHYGRLAREAGRIAVIDEVGPRLRAVPNTVQIGPNAYRRTDAWFGERAGFVVLERIERS